MGDELEQDGLIERIEIIESQPVEDRARGYEQLYNEMLAALARSDAGEE